MGHLSPERYHENQEERKRQSGPGTLHDPQYGQAQDLYEGEDVHLVRLHASNVVGGAVVFHRHEEQLHTVEQLDTVRRGDAHVEEHPEEDGHWHASQQRRHQHADADQHGDQQGAHPLLLHLDDVRLVTGRVSARHDRHRRDVRQRSDRGGAAPRGAH